MTALFRNEIIWIPLIAWSVASLIKVIMSRVQDKKLNFHYFVSSGGMPSAHSATVSSLATGIALTAGMDSPLFAIAVVLAIVVMYDAAGVRRAVSRQSIILNRIMKEMRSQYRHKGEVEKDLRELIGHTPFQVIVGAGLGSFIAWFWLFLIRQ